MFSMCTRCWRAASSSSSSSTEEVLRRCCCCCCALAGAASSEFFMLVWRPETLSVLWAVERGDTRFPATRRDYERVERRVGGGAFNGVRVIIIRAKKVNGTSWSAGGPQKWGWKLGQTLLRHQLQPREKSSTKTGNVLLHSQHIDFVVDGCVVDGYSMRPCYSQTLTWVNASTNSYSAAV